MIPSATVELLARRGGQRQAGDPRRPFSQREQATALREPVVIEHRQHPLLPLRSLMRQRVPRPDPGAEIQMCAAGSTHSGSRPINKSSRRCRASAQSVLARFFVALQRRRLGRLGQVHLGADPPQLLDHEPRASRRLKRHLEVPARNRNRNFRTRGAVRRHDPRARHLGGLVSIHSAGDLR